ncbi:penicillin-binding protein 2 [Thermodesulfobacteriota bacterium]
MQLPSGYTQEGFKTKYLIFIIIVLMFFSTIAVRLWYMQIVKGDYYKNLSENNRIRNRTTKATRGLIFDRNGEILIDNHPYFNLAIVPENVMDTTLLLDTLANIITIDKNLIREKLYEERFKPAFKPVTIIEDLPREELGKIEANKLNLPGLEIMVESVRYYQYGSLASHIFGYLNEINAENLKLNQNKGYKQGDLIGKAGVELTYESLLKGKDGSKEVEVDAFGRELSSHISNEAKAGGMLFLTLDAKLQEFVEKTFEHKAGAVVVMDVNNGHVLAQFSAPNYNPSEFIKGISTKNWKKLNEDPLNPLQNKVVAGQYSPGSVFKLVVAAAALEEGLITKNTTFKCYGSYKFGNSRFSCWKKSGHGKVNVVEAITQSCDVFFYNLGAILGIDLISEYAHTFGLGEPTGIDLEHEKQGLMPTTAWKKNVLKMMWYGGETISSAIGQSYVLVTPLQIAVLTSSIANGKFIPVPQILMKAENVDGSTLRPYIPQVKKRLKISKSTLDLLREGLYGVINGAKGTARSKKPKHVVIAGKTGTVQVFSEKYQQLKKGEEIPYRLRDHAWFTCYAPYENPEIAISVVVEHGGHGGDAAAPIAQKIADFYFTKIKGDDDSV